MPALYDDPAGGAPPLDPALAPDLGSLVYPWSAPPPPPQEAQPALDVSGQPAANPVSTNAGPPAEIAPPPPDLTQPGLGVPAGAVDAAFAAPPHDEASQAPPPPVAPTPEPQGFPAPDAISGSVERAIGAPADQPFVGTAEPRQTPQQSYTTTAARYQADPAALVDQLISGPIDDDTQRYLDAFAQRDPAGFGELQLRVADAKTRHIAAEQARIAQENHQRELDNIAMRDRAMAEARRKSEELDAEATRIASTQIGYHPTTVQRITGVLGAIVGGLVQGRTGAARNAGLDALNETINRDIEEQRMNLANRRDVLGMRRTALAQEYERSGDMYQAAELKRLADLKYADGLLATQQQNFAPDGTRGLQIAGLRAGIASQIAQNRQAVEQKNFDNSLKLQNAAREQQIADQTDRHNRASEWIDRLRLLNEEANRKEARDARAAAKTDAAEAVRQKNELERSIGGEVQEVRDAAGNVIGRQLGPIRKADGSVWVPTGTENQVGALQKKHIAAVQLVQTLDEIRRIGPEWLSNTANSDKLQRLQQLMGDARLQAIAAKDLGVPTGHDIELAENFLGTSDATRRKDSIAGLIQARQSIVRDHNAELKAHGLDKPWNPPDLSTVPVAAPSPGQLAAQHLLELPNVSAERAYRDELAYQADRLGVPHDPSGSGVILWSSAPAGAVEQATAAARAARDENRDISPEQRHDLEALQGRATAGDTQALDTLRKVAAEAHSTSVRLLAKQALAAAQIGPGGPSSGDVRLPDFGRSAAPTFPTSGAK